MDAEPFARRHTLDTIEGELNGIIAARLSRLRRNPLAMFRSMENTYSIRFARQEDLAQLHPLERASTLIFRDTKHTWIIEDGGYVDQVYQDWFETGALFVAEYAGTVVGFASAEEIDHQGFYALLCVHPEHGKRGLGRRLTDAIKHWCASRAYTSLTMTTCPDVPWNAPMFERMGFRIMDESELTPGLLDIRREELELGLGPEEHVFMTIELTAAD
jgi:GNAT superfamily N-acetyltransferase